MNCSSKHAMAGKVCLLVGKLAVAMISTVVCISALKWFGEHKLAPRTAGLGGELAAPKVDLLLIGSSHTRKSYDMRQLVARTGIEASFLISYDGADLVSISQILDYLVTLPKHCPRYLVVEAYSVLLGRKPDIQDPRYFIEAPPPLKRAIIASFLTERHFSADAFLDVFDLVANRGNDEIVAYPLYTYATKVGSYKGGRTDFSFPGVSQERFKSFKAQLYGDIPDPDQVAALYRILDVARVHHIPVIFVDTPLPAPVTSNPVIQSLKRRFRHIVVANGAVYADGDQFFPIDDPDMFSDDNHLSTHGRSIFTGKISVVLRSWINSQNGDTRPKFIRLTVPQQ